MADSSGIARILNNRNLDEDCEAIQALADYFGSRHDDTDSECEDSSDIDGNSCSSDESDDPMDDPFLYDKFLPDPKWDSTKNQVEENERRKNLVDPGQFRYNNRVLVTSLPALLIVLALGGETLVFMVAVGTTIITIMSQWTDSRTCVITFIIIFIPCHTYILASVIPLLWLTLWHFLSVGAINLYVILTAGWIILQFKAFRMEEPTLAAVIEQMLFTIYPLICTSLFCWSLAAVMSPAGIPIIFSLTWFVLLQLYLMPVVSSFRSKPTPDENLDVVQIPVAIILIATFVLIGPALQAFVAKDFFSKTSMLHLIFTIFMTLFLSSLLSIRQVFEHLGAPYSILIWIRWITGVLCTVLCYPVLHVYGLDSHFLPLLPVAIGAFAALGVVLTLKKKRTIMEVLATVLVSSLVALFYFWIQRMPHNLQHYFMGIFPLNAFYFIICVNFLLCLLCLWTAAIEANRQFGILVCCQAFALVLCEVSLHNADLYSTSTIQLTSILAAYAVHRLQVADKLSRHAAIVSTAVHMSKSLATTSSLILYGGVSKVSLLELCALGLMMLALSAVFIYNAVGEKDVYQISEQVILLLSALAINGYHILLPLSMLLFQGSKSYTNVVGLWCLIGGGLTLLYSQLLVSVQKMPVLKTSLALALCGVVIILLHPTLAFTFYSVFQWFELVTYILLAAAVSGRFEPSLGLISTISVGLAACPGIRACFMLWSHFLPIHAILCVIICAALLLLVLICLFVSEISDTCDTVIKLSVFLSTVFSSSLLALDLLWKPSVSSAFPSAITFLDLPALKAMLFTGLALSVCLKIILSTKSHEKLPTMADLSEKKTRRLPLIANAITVVTFALACLQGPSDPFMHDIWCCMSSVILGCLHGDGLLLPQLYKEKQATPTIMASVIVLNLASVLRSRFWHLAPLLAAVGGFFELLLLLVTMPVYHVVWSVLWRGEPSWEVGAVFLTPYNALLLMLGTSYTSWVTAVSGIAAGTWLMSSRLPMKPYAFEPIDHYS